VPVLVEQARAEAEPRRSRDRLGELAVKAIDELPIVLDDDADLAEQGALGPYDCD
jgi:hypothetical protein